MGEEHVSKSDFAFSVMLLLSVSFQMTVFYLVNWPDQDIRAYAWDIVGNTILIFSGVMIFAAANGMTEYFVLDAYPDFKGLIMLLQLLFWYLVLQLVSAHSSGLFHKPNTAFKYLDTETWTIQETHDKTKGKAERKRNAECFCSLLGHITAFAAIRSIGFLQDDTFFKTTPFRAYLVSWVGLAGLFILFGVARQVRLLILGRFPGKETVGEQWREIVADKENDICGLACSFLAFLAFRFAIVGDLPSIEGTVVALPEEIPALFPKVIFAMMCWVLAGVACIWFHHSSGFVDPEDELNLKTRLSNIAQNFCTMSVSWAALLAMNYFVRYQQWFESCEAIPAKILIAFLISYVAFFVMWVIDKIDDRLKERNVISSWSGNIILALGLAIGFAWEQSFDAAVDDVSLSLQQYFHFASRATVFGKMFGALILTLVVLPAFRLYIQPIIEENDEAKAKNDEEVIRRINTQQLGQEPLLPN